MSPRLVTWYHHGWNRVTVRTASEYARVRDYCRAIGVTFTSAVNV